MEPNDEAGDAAGLLNLIHGGDLAEIERRLAARPELSSAPVRDMPALCWAAFHGQDDIIRCLIRFGADPNRDASGGSTPLMATTWSHKGDACAKALLEAGAELETQNRLGCTALMEAADHGNEPILRLLLDAGADPSVKAAPKGGSQRCLGMTALDFVQKHGRASGLPELIEAAQARRQREELLRATPEAAQAKARPRM